MESKRLRPAWEWFLTGLRCGVAAAPGGARRGVSLPAWEPQLGYRGLVDGRTDGCLDYQEQGPAHRVRAPWWVSHWHGCVLRAALPSGAGSRVTRQRSRLCPETQMAQVEAAACLAAGRQLPAPALLPPRSLWTRCCAGAGALCFAWCVPHGEERPCPGTAGLRGTLPRLARDAHPCPAHLSDSAPRSLWVGLGPAAGTLSRRGWEQRQTASQMLAPPAASSFPLCWEWCAAALSG